jgi:hypothetical protein
MLRRYAMPIAIGSVVLLVVVLWPLEKSNPPEVAPLVAPPEVASVLDRACYDCHSHQTRWPWYSHVGPASWLVAHDVDEARDEVNFSTWGNADDARRKKMLEDIIDEIEKEKMPPTLYRLAHSGASLSPAEKALVLNWARQNQP